MPPRFFVEQPVQSDTVELVDAEAHHLLHVLRAKTGDVVTLFDGTGREFEGEVGRLRRSSVEVLVRSHQCVDRETPRRLIVGAALPKGDRQRWLIEKLVELGVAECVPLETSRGVAQPEGGTLEKLRRAVIEASKQCGRNRLMAISNPMDWNQFVAAAPAHAIRRVAHPPAFWPELSTLVTPPEPAASPTTSHSPTTSPSATASHSATTSNSATASHSANQSLGQSLGQFIATVRSSPVETPVYAAVGPEGGFSATEIATALHAHWRMVNLGNRILRIETAALALASAVIAAGDEPPADNHS